MYAKQCAKTPKEHQIVKTEDCPQLKQDPVKQTLTSGVGSHMKPDLDKWRLAIAGLSEDYQAVC